MDVELYINDVLGRELRLEPLPKNKLGNLPLYINAGYELFQGQLYHKELLFAQPKDLDYFSILQTEKQFAQLKKSFPVVVLLMPQITSYNRRRLIEKGINFVVPGKQLFLPDLLIDLRETELGENTKRKSATLLPSAQFLVIYHIIHRHEKWKMEEQPFKAIAERTGYTPMAITKAIENLKYEEVIDVKGDKEKFIRFRLERAELWHDLMRRKLLASPVLKKLYVDGYRNKPKLLLAGTSALPEFSDMNPSRQYTYAIDRKLFYDIEGGSSWSNLNDSEGDAGLEVWKYDPKKLVGELPTDLAVVDPLSLYLSLQDSRDERTEMALEQILNKYIW